MSVQYDLFREYDQFHEINSRLDDQKDSIRRTQKRFFAQNKELMTLIIQQNKEIEALNNRLNNIVKEKNV
jgi:predicted RNase H-like nuclease (RuvC/YqgF family)